MRPTAGARGNPDQRGQGQPGSTSGPPELVGSIRRVGGAGIAANAVPVSPWRWSPVGLFCLGVSLWHGPWARRSAALRTVVGLRRCRRSSVQPSRMLHASVSWRPWGSCAHAAVPSRNGGWRRGGGSRATSAPPCSRLLPGGHVAQPSGAVLRSPAAALPPSLTRFCRVMPSQARRIHDESEENLRIAESADRGRCSFVLPSNTAPWSTISS